MNLAEKLVTLRKKKGLSRREVAEITGISENTYKKYEISDNEKFSVRPPYERLCTLADFYGVTTDYLLDRETALEQETLTSLNLTEKEKAFIRTYAEFSPEKREHFMEILSGLSKIM